MTPQPPAPPSPEESAAQPAAAPAVPAPDAIDLPCARLDTVDASRDIGALVDRVRAGAPLVQCITNNVVTNVTANALLAFGASPAMVDIPTEAGQFAAIATGLLVNLGTPHQEQREAALEAVRSARAAGTPWVLDPVAIGALPVRTQLARLLAEQHPTVIRGNASEIIALAGHHAAGRGTDAGDSAESAIPAAQELVRATGAVVAISGPVDIVVHADGVIKLGNGTAMLTRMTGGGCVLGATIAAFVGAAGYRDLPAQERQGVAVLATCAAVSFYTIAAERAAGWSDRPGTFGVALLDALDGTDGATVARGLRWVA